MRRRFITLIILLLCAMPSHYAYSQQEPLPNIHICSTEIRQREAGYAHQVARVTGLLAELKMPEATKVWDWYLNRTLFVIPTKGGWASTKKLPKDGPTLGTAMALPQDATLSPTWKALLAPGAPSMNMLGGVAVLYESGSTDSWQAMEILAGCLRLQLIEKANKPTPREIGALETEVITFQRTMANRLTANQLEAIIETEKASILSKWKGVDASAASLNDEKAKYNAKLDSLTGLKPAKNEFEQDSRQYLVSICAHLDVITAKYPSHRKEKWAQFMSQALGVTADLGSKHRF
jgi:hypothetical protein